MSQKSSIHFKPSTSFQVFHNSVIRPKYAIGGELISNRNGYEALELKKQIIENAKEAYKTSCKARNKKFQATSYEQSAVCNIKPDTTMQDLERLAEYFEKKYGFQCYQIAIHRDEGHINDEGEKVINHHAHLEFITLDKKTGKSMYRDNLRTKKGLSQIQTEVAEILGMERGVDKRISKRERIEPRKYAQMKEQEKKAQKELKAEHKQELEAKDQEIQEIIQIQNQKNELIQDKDQKIQELIQIQNQEIQELKTELEQERLSKNQLEKLIKEERKAMIQKNKELEEANQQKIYNADDYKKLRELKEKQDITIAELNAEIEKIKQEAQEREENLRNEIRSKDQQIETLTAKNEALKAEKEQFQKLLETNQALREAYYHALKTLEKISKQNQEQKNEVIQTQNQEKTPNNEELTENNGKQATHFLNNFFKDDVSIFSKTNTDKIEISEQYQEEDQTHNENDDLGIHKIIKKTTIKK